MSPVKRKKKDKIAEILKYRLKERLRDEAITPEEAKKKYIPIYKCKPHKPLIGKAFVDFTKSIKVSSSPSK